MAGFTQNPLVSSGPTFSLPPAPLTLSFHIGEWTKILVIYKGETITIDPAEMFAALKAEK